MPLDVWRELLDAALTFRAMKPWLWLRDRDVFALEDADGRVWLPSVLGAAKQIFGLVLYRGEAGLRFLLRAAIAPTETRDLAFVQDALIVDFGAKQFLAGADREILARLGYTPRTGTRQAWPFFRSHVPGLFPWYLTPGEAREIADGLRATCACIRFALRAPGFFAPRERDVSLFPTVRMADALAGPLQPGQVVWRGWLYPPLPAPAVVFPPPEIDELLGLPLAPGGVMEFDVFHAFAPVSAPARPYFPRVGLLVDGRSGFIYAMEMVPPALPWEDLVRRVWLKAIRTARARPAYYHVQRSEWIEALAPLAGALGGKVVLRKQLPRFVEARASLDQFSQNRR